MLFKCGKFAEDYHISPCSEKFTLNKVHETEVYKELNSLSHKKTTGLDSLPPGLLKDTALVLVKALTHLINLSFRMGMVTTDGKRQKQYWCVNLA